MVVQVGSSQGSCPFLGNLFLLFFELSVVDWVEVCGLGW